MPKTAYNWHAVPKTAYNWHAVLMTAYRLHAVRRLINCMQSLWQLIAFDSISHACSYIKSIQSTQSEQLTRTSQCLFILTSSLACCRSYCRPASFNAFCWYISTFSLKTSYFNILSEYAIILIIGNRQTETTVKRWKALLRYVYCRWWLLTMPHPCPWTVWWLSMWAGSSPTPYCNFSKSTTTPWHCLTLSTKFSFYIFTDPQKRTRSRMPGHSGYTRRVSLR